MYPVFPELRSAALAAVLGAALGGAAFGLDPAPPKKKAVDPDALRREFLQRVVESDREIAGGQSAIMKSAASARRLFGDAARLMDASRDATEAESGAAVLYVARGVTGLLQGLGRADRQLGAAEQSLNKADEIRRALDLALSSRYQKLAKDLAAADRDIEPLRRRVRAQWDHSRSPRLAYKHEASRSARVKLGTLMSLASAAWQDREVKRAQAKSARNRRRRLASAARSVKTRLVEVRNLREKLTRFRKSLLSPLDGKKPLASLDKPQDWPKPLRPTMEALNDNVEPPRPFKPPSHWGIEDRVKRFLSGGSP